MTIQKFFDSDAAAAGYSSSRPFFHPIAIQEISRFLNLQHGVGAVLDVGCGAGLSAIAAAEISNSVTAIDASEAMIEQSVANENIQYVCCAAESIDFLRKFDLLTLAGSISWIDLDVFCPLAKNSLSDGGHIAIYDITFLGESESGPQFGEWYRNNFLAAFPRPPRPADKLSSEQLAAHGLAQVHYGEYKLSFPYDIDDFISFLFTLSNMSELAADRCLMESTRRELIAKLRPYFQSTPQQMIFSSFVQIIAPL